MGSKNDGRENTLNPGDKGRFLSFFDVLCLGINAIIGSGIFLFPGKLAHVAGPSSIFAFGICGLLLATVGLCYAELGSSFRRNGADYVYAREAFGNKAGFLIGWIAWATACFSWAAVANAISAYMAQFHPAFKTVWLVKITACALIGFFGTINFYGIKLGAYTVNAFTISKTLPLAIFVFVGLFNLEPSNFAGSLDFSFPVMGSAVFLCLWPLQGFERIPVVAGETQNPSKYIPMATVGSLFVVVLIYTFVQIVAVGTFPALGTIDSRKPLADAASLFLGGWGGLLMAVGAVISMTGYSAGNAMSSPRYLSVLAEDGYLPTFIAKIHEKHLTPSNAILLTTFISAIMALFLNFDTLIDISNLAVVSQYFSTCLAVIWLRYSRPDLPRAFKAPGGLIIPIIGCIISVWLIKQVKLQEFLFTVGIVFLGAFLSWLYNHLSVSSSQKSQVSNGS
ncbi:MAG: amino acid permease [Candidatus Riflebacteria bacterium]|nr:amino acid permease [Candidatus Riflebacteria bacterium]